MRLVNLTPHSIELEPREGLQISIPASGAEARVSQSQFRAGTLLVEDHLLDLVRNTFGEVTGLPEPVEGTWFLVSGMVLSALAGSRDDVVAPDTGPTAIRVAEGPKKGQIIAVTRLVTA